MTKENFFSKAFVALTMLAGLSLTSCGEKDVVIIDGEEWVKPDYQLTDKGAVITGTNPYDISRMLNRVKQEMIDAAAKGETFTIDIETPYFETSTDNNTISIPTVTGSDLVVNFHSAISSEVPLVLKSKGVDDDDTSVASTNKLTINLSTGTKVTDLEVNMPTTSVTLNAGSGININELISKTATNTLVIESGITVDWLWVKGGRVLVQDGAKVNGYILQDGNPIYGEGGIDNFGVSPGSDANGFFVYYIDENKAEKPYYTKKMKIAKKLKDNGDVDINNFTIFNDVEYAEEVEVIISDGAQVFFQFWKPTNSVSTIASVTGEGDAKILSSNSSFIKQLNHVTVEPWGEIVLPQNSEDCTFKSYGFRIQYNTSNLITENTIASFKDCEFVYTGNSENPQVVATDFPYLDATTGFNSFGISFDNCTFNKLFQFNIKHMTTGEDYHHAITFKQTKMGDKAVTSDTELIYDIYYFDTDDPQPVFNIDGKSYLPKYESGVWSLVMPE